LQAVRSGRKPVIDIPTDDHLKVFCKKTEKPNKADVVAAKSAHKRF
jgi:hypothetical protein